MHVPDYSLILRDALRVTLLRDLRALNSQIAVFPDDESIWKTASASGCPFRVRRARDDDPPAIG